MHVKLEKMRRWQGEIPMLLALALVVWNAQCFAQCLTQAGHPSATHCHPHGQSKSGHCVMQHDLTAASARAVAPVGGILAGLVQLPNLALSPTVRRCVELLAPSPPALFSKATPLPLRV